VSLAKSIQRCVKGQIIIRNARVSVLLLSHRVVWSFPLTSPSGAQRCTRARKLHEQANRRKHDEDSEWMSEWARARERERERERGGKREKIEWEKEMVLSYFARVLMGLGVELYARWLVRTGTKCHKVKTRIQRRAWCAIPSSFGQENSKDHRDKIKTERDALHVVSYHHDVKLLHRQRISQQNNNFRKFPS